jgi:hypothetical protein
VKTDTIQLRIEPELGALIKKAVSQTGLTRSEVLRQGLRRGVPQVMRALNGPRQRTLVDALFELKGLEIPERRHRFKRRV